MYIEINLLTIIEEVEHVSEFFVKAKDMPLFTIDMDYQPEEMNEDQKHVHINSYDRSMNLFSMMVRRRSMRSWRITSSCSPTRANHASSRPLLWRNQRSN